ncbi:hypothetical protein PF327_08415 [Sulfurovum sp. XTW-4]|uniref:Arginine/ornithine antiporter ArcD n=1 Tax=Sulfurovum xiamenensis TaxID=3019066 RepID=A0ABT7QT82_9BACT|nr:hypothetical protein [Sulfurovum xiamenensis]MDM5264215.1 hypothetical protein [Sulfurovum xiamenensis]
MKKQHFFLAFFFYAIAVFYLASTTPISPHEAKILYTSNDIVGHMMRWGESLNAGFLGLRAFFLFFGFLTIGLFFALSRQYFQKSKDVYLSTLIFMLLPGILTATTLANVAIIVLSLVLLFVLLYEKGYYLLLPPIMLALFFIHEASIIFFVAVLFYAVMHKEKHLAIFSLSFLLAFIYLAKGIEVSGRPSGHFVEIFGLYATVFSPLLFLYFFFAMYRILLRGEKTLIWYISFTALVFSLLLSIRQRVYITDFAPYVMIAIVLMLDVFNHAIGVRLPQFQKQYKQGFIVVMSFLLLSVLFIVGHKMLYLVLKDPKHHFADRIYRPYLLAENLKSQGIKCYDGAHGRERYQLRYYDILPCSPITAQDP